MREIIFDTETTGLKAAEGDRIIEIGAIEMVNRFPTGRTFHHYLNPQDRDIHPDAERIHGISKAQLVDKPIFADLYDEFHAFFGEGNLVAHNANFDIGFLNAELERINRPVIDNRRVVDTLAIAKRLFPGARLSLDALCSRFGISNEHRTLHGALLDTELLADVYLELTGGRQVSFGLDVKEETSNGRARVENEAARPQKQRSKPLPNLLSEAEKQAHSDFVETLGEDAIWRKWQPQHGDAAGGPKGGPKGG
ncbi:MAG: DNA polymerase III subunit epsilon [Pseudomonadota bacterium]